MKLSLNVLSELRAFVFLLDTFLVFKTSLYVLFDQVSDIWRSGPYFVIDVQNILYKRKINGHIAI